MATVIAIHDLSGLGRCSLTTALAVLPAMRHTCYPLPTAVLSQQTAFSGYTFLDLTDQMGGQLAAWDALDIQPDMIYTGFLGSGQQAELISAYVETHPEAVMVVDPVMGDHGELYRCYQPAYVEHMRQLARSAHLLIPNITELMLLAGLPADTPLPKDDQALLELVRGIGAKRLQSVVVTSAIYAGATCNLLIDLQHEQVQAFPVRHNGVAYSGAGDLFASLLCGWMANGVALHEAIPKAAAFVTAAAERTPSAEDPRFGLHYPSLLGQLTEQKERGNMGCGMDEYDK